MVNNDHDIIIVPKKKLRKKRKGNVFSNEYEEE